MYIRAERHEYIDNINRLNKFVLSINPGVHILLCHTKTGRNDFDYANIDVSHHIYIAGIDLLILDLIFSTEQWDFHKLIDRRNPPEICRILQAAVRGLQSIFTMISREREREMKILYLRFTSYGFRENTVSLYFGFWIIYWNCLMAKHSLFDFIIGKSINQYAHNWVDGLQSIISTFTCCLLQISMANSNSWWEWGRASPRKHCWGQLIPIKGTRIINLLLKRQSRENANNKITSKYLCR